MQTHWNRNKIWCFYFAKPSLPNTIASALKIHFLIWNININFHFLVNSLLYLKKAIFLILEGKNSFFLRHMHSNSCFSSTFSLKTSALKQNKKLSCFNSLLHQFKEVTSPKGSSWVKFLTKPYGVMKNSVLESPSVNFFPQQDK